jgi:hypothetical protein
MKHLFLLTGAAFLLSSVGVNAEAEAVTAPAPQQQTEPTKTIDKSTKTKVVPPITSPEMQLKMNENDVMEAFPG